MENTNYDFQGMSLRYLLELNDQRGEKADETSLKDGGRRQMVGSLNDGSPTAV